MKPVMYKYTNNIKCQLKEEKTFDIYLLMAVVISINVNMVLSYILKILSC
jgi:hypothetical protein